MNQLPEKLSDLLRLAVTDAQAVEKDPRYELDMGLWHTAMVDGPCLVCMAGAVMANTLGLPVDQSRNPYDYQVPTREQLVLIDHMRRGHSVGVLPDDGAEVWSFIQENFDTFIARAPWEIYLKAADMLEALGL